MKSRHQPVLIVLGVNLIFHLILCLLFLIDPGSLVDSHKINSNHNNQVQQEIKDIASVSTGNLVNQGGGAT